jgi:hypothetical protein
VKAGMTIQKHCSAQEYSMLVASGFHLSGSQGS